MPFTGFAIIDHTASCSASAGIVGKPARGRFCTQAGRGETTTFDGASRAR